MTRTLLTLALLVLPAFAPTAHADTLRAAVARVDASTFPAQPILADRIPSRPVRLWVKIAIGCSAGAQIFDAVSTAAAIGTGKFHEANGALAAIAEDPAKLAAVKAGMAVGSTAVFLHTAKEHPKATAAIASAACFGIGYVAHRNFENYRDATRGR